MPEIAMLISTFLLNESSFIAAIASWKPFAPQEGVYTPLTGFRSERSPSYSHQTYNFS
jgi:hypothetical protein